MTFKLHLIIHCFNQYMYQAICKKGSETLAPFTLIGNYNSKYNETILCIWVFNWHAKITWPYIHYYSWASILINFLGLSTVNIRVSMTPQFINNGQNNEKCFQISSFDEYLIYLINSTTKPRKLMLNESWWNHIVYTLYQEITYCTGDLFVGQPLPVLALRGAIDDHSILRLYPAFGDNLEVAVCFC